MKKFTKRLTMVVAILLSLVLLTSSIVSTTLAKYVVTKSVTTTAQLQKFGLDVTLDLNNTLEASADIKNTGDSATITISDFKLKPGDDYRNAITASITGTPTVDANVTITVSVNCDDSNFMLDKDVFDALNFSKDQLCTPVGFFVNSQSKVASYYKTDFVTGSTTTLGTYITGQLVNAINTNVGDKISSKTKVNNSISGKILSSITTPVNINNIGIGFAWSETSADATNGNYEIGTYIADKEPTYTITYTIKVEQAS